MDRISRGSRSLPGTLSVLVLLLAACSGDSTTDPNGSAPLTQAEAQAVGEEMQGEIEGITSGSALINFLAPDFPTAPAARRALGGSVAFASPPAGCPTFSEFPPTDLDADGIPDNLTVTFDSLVCVFTHPSGQARKVLSGSVTISDPSQVDPGLRVVFADLLHRTTIQDTIFFQRQADGVWQLVASAAGFSATDSTTVSHESSRHGAAVLAKRWQVDFTAAQGETYIPHLPLPSGDFEIDGSTTRTRGSDSKSFVVTTAVPLHHDATCDAELRIVSGELDIVHTDPRGTASVNIVFNACGVEPTITLVTGPTAS